MDGLLIDSEPLWREAEIAVFGSVGLRLTDELCRQTTGLRIDEVVTHWHRKSPWPGPSREQVTEQILVEVQRMIIERGVLMEGARDTIMLLHAEGLALAVASSSPIRLIHAVLDKFSLRGYFSALHSAEREMAGKPDPAVYLSTMSLLGAEPHHCLALEDSLSGVRAAKAAGAMVIAVPAPEDALDPGFELADLKLTSLRSFSIDLIQHR
jgi:sugar-phosphatase